MKRPATALPLDIRSFRQSDEQSVVELLQAAMGDGPAGPRTADFFRWKHLENPFGRSLMMVAEADGAIIGFRAFMRWQLRTRGRLVHAVQAVDTATHPNYQGMGVFSALTLAALERLRGDADLIYNTPNEKSLPGYLKMGWRTVGKLPVSIRVRHPVRFARSLRTMRDRTLDNSGSWPVQAEPGITVLANDEVEELLLRDDTSRPTLSTARDAGYLRWRYGDSQPLDYRAVREEKNGHLRGIALFRVRARGHSVEAAVVDMFAPRDDGRILRSLLRQVMNACDVDHLTCHFPHGSVPAQAARRVGFVRSPIGITLVVNPLGSDINPDPTSLRSWNLSLGDLEVF